MTQDELIAKQVREAWERYHRVASRLPTSHVDYETTEKWAWRILQDELRALR